MKYRTDSAAETVALGRALASALGAGAVVAFHGELGAGKTTMIRGVCTGLGVTETVKSPSFVIVTEYRGRVPVYHVDLYRLGPGSDFDAFGLDECLGGDGVCLVEWGERAETRLPAGTIRVRMEVSGVGRTIAIAGLDRPLKPVE